MSDTSEKKIEDTQGQYLHAVKNGREINDATWQQCRVILTDERIVLVADGKIAVPLTEIDEMGGRYDVNDQAASETNYSTLHVGDDILLVTTSDHETFETNFYRAFLDGAVVYVKHPAVVGGVIQGAEWQRGRLKVTKETVRMVLEDGQKFVIDRSDIGEMEIDQRQVAGEQRSVIEVEHSDDDGTSMETYLSGREHHLSVLKQLLEEGAERNRADLDLDPIERRVVMALYSGVSPFAISDFVGIDVEKVEEIYDQLLELEVIEVVRERKEVSLTAQGRKVAGEAMGEQ
jgi:helix-turn-helix protein